MSTEDTAPKFKPATPGEVRGPWRSSPGNPWPWQAAYYTGNGWVYSHAMTAAKALKQTKEAAAAYTQKPEP